MASPWAQGKPRRSHLQGDKQDPDATPYNNSNSKEGASNNSNSKEVAYNNSNSKDCASPMSRDPSFVTQRASRYASTRSSVFYQMALGGKGKKLPPHIEDVLHLKDPQDLRVRHFNAQGIHVTEDLLTALDRKLRVLPWEPGYVSSRQSRDDDSYANRSVASNSSRAVLQKHRKLTESPSATETDKYDKFDAVIAKMPFGKITFTNKNEPMEVVPNWVTHRLEDSCRRARFSLPSDYRRLEGMTPLEYLEKHTHLSRAQRRRYDKVFSKFMDKNDKHIKKEELYPALNSMFANSLGKDNYYILCITLFVPRDFVVQSRELFAGICALTERLFWSSYLEGAENTFFLMGPNRSLLECADFNGLQWKLKDLDISVEMRTLLFSLA